MQIELFPTDRRGDLNRSLRHKGTQMDTRHKKLIFIPAICILFVSLLFGTLTSTSNQARKICLNAFDFLVELKDNNRLTSSGTNQQTILTVELAPSILCEGVENCQHANRAVLQKVAKCLTLKGFPMEERLTDTRIKDSNISKDGNSTIAYIFKVDTSK